MVQKKIVSLLDKGDCRSKIHSRLRKSGYRIQSCRNIDSLLQLVKRKNGEIHGVVVDLYFGMTGQKTGLEIAKSIRFLKREYGWRLPIVLCVCAARNPRIEEAILNESALCGYLSHFGNAVQVLDRVVDDAESQRALTPTFRVTVKDPLGRVTENSKLQGVSLLNENGEIPLPVSKVGLFILVYLLNRLHQVHTIEDVLDDLRRIPFYYRNCPRLSALTYDTMKVELFRVRKGMRTFLHLYGYDFRDVFIDQFVDGDRRKKGFKLNAISTIEVWDKKAARLARHNKH